MKGVPLGEIGRVLLSVIIKPRPPFSLCRFPTCTKGSLKLNLIRNQHLITNFC